MGKQLIDLTGQRFGRLVVMGRDGTYRDDSSTVPQWRCRCDCGTECVVSGKSLRRGATKSCGCLRSEKTKARHEQARKRKEAEDG